MDSLLIMSLSLFGVTHSTGTSSGVKAILEYGGIYSDISSSFLILALGSILIESISAWGLASTLLSRFFVLLSFLMMLFLSWFFWILAFSNTSEIGTPARIGGSLLSLNSFIFLANLL